MEHLTGEDGEIEFPAMSKQQAIEELTALLAPVLTHHQGMAAAKREERFRAAINTLIH